MADSQIAERVQAIIVDKLGVEASEVTPEASFAADHRELKYRTPSRTP